jgi:hypothetical protein
MYIVKVTTYLDTVDINKTNAIMIIKIKNRKLGGSGMDVEISIEKERMKPKVVIYTNEVTSEINELVKRLSDYSEPVLVGYRDDEAMLLNLEDIYRSYAQEQKVVAETQKEKVYLKFRLYELERDWQEQIIKDQIMYCFICPSYSLSPSAMPTYYN